MKSLCSTLMWRNMKKNYTRFSCNLRYIMWSFIWRRGSFLRTIELNFLKLLFGGGGWVGHDLLSWSLVLEGQGRGIPCHIQLMWVNIFVVKHDDNITKSLDPTIANGLGRYLGWYTEEQALKKLNPNTFVC